VPSDVTSSSGRLWAQDAPVNAPLDVPAEGGTVRSVTLDASTLVLWPPAGSTVPIRHLRRAVLIDVTDRQVVDVEDGTVTMICDLDTSAPDGIAAGLVLARDIVAERIEHAVAVTGPYPPGTRLAIDPAGLDPTLHVTPILSAALATYGAHVIATGGPGLTLHVERPASARTAHGGDLGPLYRPYGLTREGIALGSVAASCTPPPMSPRSRKVARIPRSARDFFRRRRLGP
jgi:hypothetical protein